MNLKKSDKMIAVVGVIIVIIAAVGIFFYATEEVEEVVTEPEKKTFYVTWIKETGETSIDGKAEKIYNEPFTVPAPSGVVLTNVDFRLTWEDDHVTGLILKRFYDTLKAEISLEGSEPPQPYTSKGGCENISLPLFSVNDIPTIDSVEANDTYAAEEIINEMIFGQDTATFDVKVTVKTGEKPRRPLKFLKDKGNSFELKITYEYYTFVIEDGEPEEPPEEPEENEGYSGIVLLIKNLCHGRDWI